MQVFVCQLSNHPTLLIIASHHSRLKHVTSSFFVTSSPLPHRLFEYGCHGWIWLPWLSMVAMAEYGCHGWVWLPWLSMVVMAEFGYHGWLWLPWLKKLFVRRLILPHARKLRGVKWLLQSVSLSVCLSVRIFDICRSCSWSRMLYAPTPETITADHHLSCLWTWIPSMQMMPKAKLL